ncbi:MAG: EAL domain-containing protein [Clostridia bacterium]|nr:EAL domain-containing protein [Clostridia bacterium]
MTKRKHTRLFVIYMLLLTVILAISSQLCVLAKNSGRTVRVGWYESPFNTTDESGRRTGYAYQYQQKIAAYSGWQYEYVEGSWTDLLEMLVDGRIDLMSDVSYTEERAKNMLYSAHPMGSEDYFVFVAPGNTEIKQDDYSTFNGKRIGINKGSVQIGFYNKWAAENNVHAELVEMTGTEFENIEDLNSGKIDMYVTLDAFGDTEHTVPVCKIGSSDFYFAVNKNHPEILAELNTAMNRIQGENPYYYQQLYAKHINTSGINMYLSSEEIEWLESHGTVRVGYQDNYLSFCAKDPKTGELTGALKDYLEIASDCLMNAHIDFEAFVYPTAAAALEAVKKGEVDCMFPANLTDYDGETQGFFMTPPLMSTDMSAVVQESEHKSFLKKDNITVAVNIGNPNYDLFLQDHFPDWRAIYFQNTPVCLKAISEGRADCLLISNYRFNNISKLCEKYHLVPVSTGVEMDYCLAVSRENTILYSILSKITHIVPDSSVDAALSYYYTEDARVGVLDLIVRHLGVVIFIVLAILLTILLLLLYNVRAKKEALNNLELIEATQTDALTGLYTKTYFMEYANRMYLENPDRPLDAIVLNINRFHTVNAINGHLFGDSVLEAISGEIKVFLSENEGIAGHFEADHFSIICSHFDDYRALYDRLQEKIEALSTNAEIRLRMGVMPWQKGTPPQHLIEQALVACNIARRRFKDPLVIFDDTLREQENREMRILSDLPRALKEHEFEVYYQPKYDIRRDSPVLCGAEALVRWRHPDLGILSPGEFIPLFEENGNVEDIDKYVWKEAAKQVAIWQKKYKRLIPVSINLSRVDVFDPNIEQILDGILEENGLDYSAISLEVTESAYSESTEEIISVIKRLHKKGYRIEMDDFGTGYSSLNMLYSMPIDGIKMDRAFVRNIEHSEKNMNFVELILDIANNLNVPVIAEGVETEMQYQTLKKVGCSFAQGFYFSLPLTAYEFEINVIEKYLADK